MRKRFSLLVLVLVHGARRCVLWRRLRGDHDHGRVRVVGEETTTTADSGGGRGDHHDCSRAEAMIATDIGVDAPENKVIKLGLLADLTRSVRRRS